MGFNPKNWTPDRQRDLFYLQNKLADPNTPEGAKKKAQEAIYLLNQQAQSQAIQKARERLRIATMEGRKMRDGNKTEVERLSEQMRKTMDRDYSLDT